LLLTKPARHVRPIGPRSRGSFTRCTENVTLLPI
jgi:hypothetical protein